MNGKRAGVRICFIEKLDETSSITDSVSNFSIMDYRPTYVKVCASVFAFFRDCSSSWERRRDLLGSSGDIGAVSMMILVDVNISARNGVCNLWKQFAFEMEVNVVRFRLSAARLVVSAPILSRQNHLLSSVNLLYSESFLGLRYRIFSFNL